MPGMTEEQTKKLDEINAGEGKKLSAAQKAIMLKFGRPKVTPKPRENPVKPIEVDDSSVKLKED
jgi:hypothetical protein|tara:strand:- start:658 stop:849 length:192 start_codon:yes stop_codon:yes gene_type:complete